MPGFGHELFGHHPFGRTDFGRAVVINTFPTEYLEGDEARGEPLGAFLAVISNAANQRKSEADQLNDMIDINRIRADIIRNLGSTFDIETDDFETEDFQRSLVGNTFQVYQRKGPRIGYRIRGKISGFDVDVVNFWQIPSGTAATISGAFPLTEKHIFEIPEGSGTVSGTWFTDLPPGTVSGTAPSSPVPGNPFPESCEYCLTAFIKVVLTLVKIPPPASTVNIVDRLLEKLKEVTPIHVRQVFIEIKIFFEAEETITVEAADIEEVAGVFASEFFRYDIIAADIVACDQKPQVYGTATEGP